MGLDSSAYGNYPTPFAGIFQILLKKPSYSSSTIIPLFFYDILGCFYDIFYDILGCLYDMRIVFCDIHCIIEVSQGNLILISFLRG